MLSKLISLGVVKAWTYMHKRFLGVLFFFVPSCPLNGG